MTEITGNDLSGLEADISSKIVNSPYFGNFDNWFDLANNIRQKQGLSLLKRNGRIKDFDNTNIEAYQLIHQAVPKDFFEKEYDDGKRGKVFKDKKVPAHVARVIIDENYVLSKEKSYISKPHLPGITSSWDNKLITIPKSKLSDLVTAGIITSDIKTKLDSLSQANFGFTSEIDSKMYSDTITIDSKEYVNLDLKNTSFLFKKSGETNFKLAREVKQVGGGSSGITIGFGYDMGQQNFNEKAWKEDEKKIIEKYTPYGSEILPNWQNILNVDIKRVTKTDVNPVPVSKLSVFQLAFKDFKPHFQGDSATDLLKVFNDVIWNKLDYPYETAVEKFKDFILNEYASIMMNQLYRGDVTNPVFKLLPSDYYNNKDLQYYFQSNGLDVLNEVEKFIALTFVYNGGQTNVTLNYNSKNVGISERRKKRRTARYVTQALNTHDIRWLRLCLTPPYSDDPNDWVDWLGLDKNRNKEIRSLLFRDVVIKHFRN